MANYPKTIDEKNVYFESTHFKAIAGIGYQDSQLIQTLAYKILEYAEDSWEVLVETLEFPPPRNSDIQKISIFIGDRSAYDYTYEIFITIGSNFAGWANYYEDGTPHFVINPRLSSNDLKVTISHEFFHTIQFAYFEANDLETTKWRTNTWWLEATAMMAEDEVYDDLNSYISYISSFFNQSYRSIETFNGIHEYAMVIFAKYIKERYGMQMIKDSFPLIMQQNFAGYFEILDHLLKTNHSSSMKKALKEFGVWVANSSIYFEEGELYPQLRAYEDFNLQDVQKGGIVKLQNYPNFFVKSNENYNATLIDAKEYVISDREDSIIISNYNDEAVNRYDILSNQISSVENFTYGVQFYLSNNHTELYTNEHLLMRSQPIDDGQIIQQNSEKYIKFKIDNMNEPIKFYGNQ